MLFFTHLAILYDDQVHSLGIAITYLFDWVFNWLVTYFNMGIVLDRETESDSEG